MQPTEARMVKKDLRLVERVRLRAQQEHLLYIRQGSTPCLAVTAAPAVLHRVKTRVKNRTLFLKIGGSWGDRLRDSLSTSLTRAEIRYDLVLRKLTGLEVFAFAQVRVAGLETDRLHLVFQGAGLIEVDNLRAELLEVDFQGAGRICVSGEVDRQAVRVTGPGEYRGGQLLSGHTQISIGSAGKATVWASETLDVTVQGIGCVDYFGYPRVRHHLSPMGRLAHAGMTPP